MTSVLSPTLSVSVILTLNFFLLFPFHSLLSLSPPLPLSLQVAVWENSVFDLRVLRHVVWTLQSDNSHPVEHGVFCESMLSSLR